MWRGTGDYYNGKHKGQGNTKNGNNYVAWALVEVANFAVRYYPHSADLSAQESENPWDGGHQGSGP
jgi:hypothetical protein